MFLYAAMRRHISQAVLKIRFAIAVCMFFTCIPAFAQSTYEGTWTDTQFGKGVAVFQVESRDGDKWTGEFRDRTKGGNVYKATLTFAVEGGRARIQRDRSGSGKDLSIDRLRQRRCADGDLHRFFERSTQVEGRSRRSV